MAHPSRVEYFGYLRDTIGDCTIPISVDDGCGIWENCKRAWRAHDKDADWHLVLQDDAIICENFKERLQDVIIKAKEKKCVASLFFGKRTLLMDVGKEGMKHGFVIKGMLHWGLAICLPVELIEPMIRFGDKMNIPQDDARISNFLMKRKIGIYYPLPSIVDHRITKSLVGDLGPARVAYKFIDHEN